MIKAATIKMPAPIKNGNRYCGMKPMVNKSIQMANKKKQALANSRLFFVNDPTSSVISIIVINRLS